MCATYGLKLWLGWRTVHRYVCLTACSFLNWLSAFNNKIVKQPYIYISIFDEINEITSFAKWAVSMCVTCVCLLYPLLWLCGFQYMSVYVVSAVVNYLCFEKYALYGCIWMMRLALQCYWYVYALCIYVYAHTWWYLRVYRTYIVNIICVCKCV